MNALQESRKTVSDIFSVKQGADFEPTGLQEPAVEAVGNAAYRIINVQIANKIGKTTIASQIMKNILWDPDPTFFNYPAFKDWPFVDDKGNPIRRARIAGTKENVLPSGPIFNEVENWWPRGRYQTHKEGHTYYKSITTDTNWDITTMSYEQKAKEWEGPLLSFIWADEPPKPDILGAMMSRLSKGGILLLTQTPLGAGPILDAIEDLESQGCKVIHIRGNIYDNDTMTGKPNSKGTKCGLMTTKEIEEYVSSIPPDEKEARVYGRATHKSGKIFPEFDRAVHMKKFNLDSEYFRLSNKYMVMDPHRKYYPFLQWWAVTPDERFICFNEWPSYQTLGNNYYDQVRHNKVCPFSPEEISSFIKALDLPMFGFKTRKRAIDPRFAKGTESDWTKTSDGIIVEYAKYGMKFDLPDFETIETQRLVIKDLLKYDEQQEVSTFNEPQLYVLPHCRNTIRSLERHYWEEDKEKEAERYKDPIDCIRYLLSLIGGVVYREEKEKKGPEEKIVSGLDHYGGGMKRISI